MIKWETKVWKKEKNGSIVEFICDRCNISKFINIGSAKEKKYQLCRDCYVKSEFKVESGKKARIKNPVNGKNNPNYKGKTEFKCLCGDIFLRRVSPSQEGVRYYIYCSTKCKKKYSISKAKYFEYKNMKLRSSWELAFAQYLDSNNYSWRYEPEAFETSYGFYTPDFWVDELNCYFEVKGYFRDEIAKGKFEEFSKTYNTVLADLDYFKSIGFQRVKSGPKKGQLCPQMAQP